MRAWRPSRGARTHAHGFVLLEVLVALALLAVGIVAVLSAALSTLDLQSDCALRRRAGLVLDARLAEIADGHFDGVDAQGIATDPRFRWSVRSEPWRPDDQRPHTVGVGDDALPPPGMCRVVVVVDWTTSSGVRSIRATQIVRGPVAPRRPS